MQPKPAEWFHAGIAFAASIGPDDKLFVHCGHGINRGPVMAYAILRSQGYLDAEAMMRAARPQMGASMYLASADAALE